MLLRERERGFADLEISRDTLVAVLPGYELFALTAARALPAVARVVAAAGRETLAGPAGGEVPAVLSAGVALEPGDPGPAGTLTSSIALASRRAGGVAVTGLAGLALARQEVLLLTSLTVSPGPASPALQALHPVASLPVEAGAELAPAGPAIALTGCKYHQVSSLSANTSTSHLLEPVNQAV